jgi:hypothetical protein
MDDTNHCPLLSRARYIRQVIIIIIIVIISVSNTPSIGLPYLTPNTPIRR